MFKAIIGLFHTMVTANRTGKEALKQLLDKLSVQAKAERGAISAHFD